MKIDMTQRYTITGTGLAHLLHEDDGDERARIIEAAARPVRVLTVGPDDIGGDLGGDGPVIVQYLKTIIKDRETKAKSLWALLDDIDTLSDRVKPDPSPYHDGVTAIIAKRHAIMPQE